MRYRIMLGPQVAVMVGAGLLLAQHALPADSPVGSVPAASQRSTRAIDPAAATFPAYYREGILSDQQLKGLLAAMGGTDHPVDAPMDLPWYDAVEIAGAIRETRAIDAAVARLGVAGELNNYPAGAALQRIGLPAVQPIVDEVIRNPEVNISSAGRVLAVASGGGAVEAWVDQYVERSRVPLDEPARARITDLKASLRNYLRAMLYLPSLGTRILNHPIVRERERLIHENLQILKDYKDWDHLSPEAERAIVILGNLRASEANGILSDHLLARAIHPVVVRDGQAELSPDLLAEYPAAKALTRIADEGGIRSMQYFVIRAYPQREAAEVYHLVLDQILPESKANQSIGKAANLSSTDAATDHISNAIAPVPSAMSLAASQLASTGPSVAPDPMPAYVDGLLSEQQLDFLLTALGDIRTPAEPSNEMPWHVAADLVGVIRETRAIPVLVASLNMPIDRDAAPVKTDNQFPAIRALEAIGLPAVQPLFDDFISNPKSGAGAVLVRIAPGGEPYAWNAWIDRYVEHSREPLNDAARRRVEQLKESIWGYRLSQRPPEPPIDLGLFNHPIVRERNRLIGESIQFLEGYKDWEHLSPEAARAIQTLGNLRATQAVEILGKHLLVQGESPQPMAMLDGQAENLPDPLASYPAARALVRIADGKCLKAAVEYNPIAEEQMEADEVIVQVLFQSVPPEDVRKWLYPPVMDKVSEAAHLHRMEILNKILAATKPATTR